LAEKASGCETFEVLQVPVVLSYPKEGQKDLPVGKTIIDIISGQVFLPDATEDIIYSPFKVNLAGSLLLYTDATIKVELYKEGAVRHTTSMFPLWSRFKELEFDRVEITTTKKTIFYMAVSNIPDGVPDMIEAPYIEGNPFVYRDAVTVPVAGTMSTIEIDVRETLGRNTQTGFIANMGTTAGDIYIYEDAGDGYTDDYYTVVRDGVENLNKCNISKLKIGATVNDTTFELNFR